MKINEVPNNTWVRPKGVKTKDGDDLGIVFYHSSGPLFAQCSDKEGNSYTLHIAVEVEIVEAPK